jgi:hypothetical protein
VDRRNFFGAEQLRQVSAQLTVQSFADTIDVRKFLDGQGASQPPPQHRVATFDLMTSP